jgi:hypothetical protein
MQRFFFDWYDGEDWHEDEFGVELGSAAAIEAEASRAVPDIAKERLPDGKEASYAVRVRDDDGPVLDAKLTYQRRWHRKPD